MTTYDPGWVRPDTDQDPVASLRDVESEAGDDGGVDDLFLLDRTEAEELGIALDPIDGPEPLLD